MNKTSSAIYGISGMLICVLAIFSFVHNSGSLLQRLIDFWRDVFRVCHCQPAWAFEARHAKPW